MPAGLAFPQDRDWKVLVWPQIAGGQWGSDGLRATPEGLIWLPDHLTRPAGQHFGAWCDRAPRPPARQPAFGYKPVQGGAAPELQAATGEVIADAQPAAAEDMR